jgi:Domain of unknown function (DUF1906)
MPVKQATPSTGFDLNQPLTASMAAQFKSAGHSFAIRYIPRTAALVKGNLTAAEIEIILGAGLNLMAVQHCALPGWEPNAAMGGQYGQYAATYSQSIGLPARMNIWLDLEGVGPLVKAEDVIAYCEAWFTAVSAVGYVPGIYVGWNIVITDQQLYDLPFAHYWRAYNCEQVVLERGYQIVQHPQQTLDRINYDPNTLVADGMGGLPVWLSPE